MSTIRVLFVVSLLLSVAGIATAAEKPHVVIVVGTHHYAPQNSMPLFAAELERLGMRTTIVNPDWDPERDPRGLPGIKALAEADVAIFFARFLKLDEQQLSPIMKYVQAGKPVVGLRTTTHAFNYPVDHPRRELNMSFGRDVMGTPYRIHLQGATQVNLVKNIQHAILTGVGNESWESPGTLYLTNLQSGVQPLLVGTGSPAGKKAIVKTNAFGTHELQPIMTDTIAWTWSNKWQGRTFSTSLGHPGDFACPQSMRVMVNGVFWAAGLEVPKAEVEIKTFTIASHRSKKKPKKRPQK